MRCVDVNALVYGLRREAADHDRYRQWLDDARRADEPLGVARLVLSGFLRIVTHPRIFRDPTPLEVALELAADRGFARFPELRWRHPLEG